MPSSYNSGQKAAIAQFVSFTSAKDSVAAKVCLLPRLTPAGCHASPKNRHEKSGKEARTSARGLGGEKQKVLFHMG